ncbi:hypothetical protein [Nonomuraea jiangxiensis]|uniref:Uncharacterized protein n=1 Tax=Nonomuraea jiangxiensis TaxID=633440 RepID=A0A1G8DAA3_9ACTN|nr:hypothetical protein [Nonomuraea jiangxiensis]SDH54585.1 hypothetical protein SAMN05421869_102513 [Nonomuraea jiangxiensis]
MTSTDWPVYSPFAREHYGRGLKEGESRGRAAGRAEEAARSVLLVLTARGFDVPDDTRARITTCADLDQLRTWLIRAATIPSLPFLFTPPT